MHDVNTLLEEIRVGCCDVLQDNLTGVYVHGSLAFGCFTWERSDVDILIVVRRPLRLNEKTALLKALLKHERNYPPKGLEMSVVLEEDCRSFTHPMHYELHYSVAHREKYRQDAAAYCESMQGTDRDLAAHCTVINAVGYPLHGKPVAEVFSPVPVCDYLDSLEYDIASARVDIAENPVYVALNLCRVLAYLQDGIVLSKQQGGMWGLSHLSHEWKPLLEQTLHEYAGECTCGYQVCDLVRFADDMCSQIMEYGMLRPEPSIS